MFSKLIVICVFFFNFKECFAVTQENWVTLSLSSVEETWSQAMNLSSTQCNVFSSDILKDLNKARASIATTAIGQLGWIGAYRYYTHWIRLKRCSLVKPSDIQLVSSTIIHGGTQNSVTFCTSACRNSLGTVKIFALSEFHCFCLSENPVSRGTCVPTPCHGDVRDFCGCHGDNYQHGNVTDVMIYETDTTLVTSGSGECVTVEYTGDVFLTGFSKTVRIFENPSDEDCTKAHGVICKLEGAVIINLSRIFYNDPRKTWSDAVSRCYQQSAYQISTDLDSLTQNNSALSNSENAWLGIFRRHYNFTINTKPDILSTESNIHCIAASVDITGNIQLSNHKCNKSLPVWCMLQANVTLSSSTTPITTSRTTDVSTTPENMVTNSVKAVSSSVEITQDISLLITTTVLATIVGIGILTAIIILLRKIFKSRKTQSNVSIRHAIPNHKRKIQKNKSKSHYEESLNAVYEEDIYSVIIDNNEEIPRYSEVIYDDVENNDTKNISSQKYVNTLPSLGRTESSTNSQLKEIPEYLEIIPYEPQNISEKTGVESNCQETGDFCKLNNENGAANEESSMFSDAKEAVDGKTTV